MNLTQQLPRVNDIYQQTRFQEFLETHLNYLLLNHITSQELVKDNDAARYKGDFYGLLQFLKIGHDYHYILLRVNGFTNPSEYDGEPIVVKYVNVSEVDSLANVYRTRKIA